MVQLDSLSVTGPAPRRRLTLILDNQRIRVPPRLIIGRQSAFCDLVIDDASVSRVHAAVLFRQGTFYLFDMGSMNGIGFAGERISRKRIREGDRFSIGRHALVFTYQVVY